MESSATRLSATTDQAMPKRAFIFEKPTKNESITLNEMTANAGFESTSFSELSPFVAALKESPHAVGVIEFDRLLPSPQKVLNEIRSGIAKSTRLAIVYNEGAWPRQVGERLMGIRDIFVPRPTSPFGFASVLGQLYFNNYIEQRLDNAHAGSSRDGEQLQHVRDLVSLGSALLGCHSSEEVWRSLSLRIPAFLDVSFLSILTLENEVPKLHVLSGKTHELKHYMELEQRIAASIGPFSSKILAQPEVTYESGFRGLRPLPAKDTGRLMMGDPVPMVINGTLVGALGLAVYANDRFNNSDLEKILVPLSLFLSSAIANIQLLNKIEAVSVTDELTGAYNRKNLKSSLDKQVSSSMRTQSPFSIVIVDIDHFKKFNTIYGHGKGDQVLKELAEFLTKNLRNQDRLVRFGGEEFLIVMPGVDAARAMLAMERIRAALASDPLPAVKDSGDTDFTFSAGIADFTISEVGTGPDQLLSFVDQALYQAKVSGRNCTCIYKPGAVDAGAKSRQNMRKYPRVDCQIPIRVAELSHFAPRYLESLAINISSGGVAIRDVEKRFSKHMHLLMFLSGQQDPIVCRVVWVKETNGGRLAGLEFVKSAPFADEELIKLRKKALVITDNDSVKEKANRILNAAGFEVATMGAAQTVDDGIFSKYDLLLVGESSYRKEIGMKLERLRETDAMRAKIIFVNEGKDRLRAIGEIQSSKIEHLVANEDAAMETLFSGLNKILLGEIFGIKKYLMWGAGSKLWFVEDLASKEAALEGIHKYSLEVKCHPRIAELLAMAVDEMLLNAINLSHEKNKNPITVECGSDGRLLTVSVLDEYGTLRIGNIYDSLANALKTMQQGPNREKPSAGMGFQFMLSALSQLSVNVSPGKCTELIGIVDLRKDLKQYRLSVPSFGHFVQKRGK